MEPGNLIDRRQTDPNTPLYVTGSRRIRLVKFFMHVWNLFLGNSSARIRKKQRHPSITSEHLYCEFRAFSRVFREIRKRVMKYPKHSFLFKKHLERGLPIDGGRLFLKRELRQVFHKHFLGGTLKIETFSYERSGFASSNFLVLQNGIRRGKQAFDLILNDLEVFRIKWHYSVFHAFEKDLESRYRSLNLVREVRDEVGSDFFLP